MVMLRGFPPSNSLEPGMPVEKISETYSNCHKAALIGFASKGPANTVVAVRTSQQLHSSFGYPHPESGSYLIYSAEQALLTLPEILVVRVMDASLAKTATAPILDDTGKVTFTILADSPGIEGNDTRVSVMNDPKTNTFTLSVFHNGVQVETWGQLSKDRLNKYYVKNFIELVSEWIRINDMDNFRVPKDGMYYLSGGNDGIPTDTNERDILLSNKENLTGVYAFYDQEQTDIDLIAVPGQTSAPVVTSLLDVCDHRRDCLAIIDTPSELSYLESSLWQRGKYNNSICFESDFAAMFWPWLQIRDQYNRIDVTIPPSGAVIATIARADTLSAPWFSPMGETRGIIPGILDVSHCLTHGDSKNAINAIVPFANGNGFMISSQKTLQKGGRIDVRRMLIFIEKCIRHAAEALAPAIDVNDELFRKEFVQICENVMSQVKNGGGINDYIIQVNEFDSPEQVEKNEFRTRIGVRPINENKNLYIEFLFC